MRKSNVRTQGHGRVSWCFDERRCLYRCPLMSALFLFVGSEDKSWHKSHSYSGFGQETLTHLRVLLQIWDWRPGRTATAGCQQDCRTSKWRLWAGILHTQRSRWSTLTHARPKPSLLFINAGSYHSRWRGTATAGCGEEEGTEGRASLAGRPAPDSNPSNHILAWAWTEASAVHHTNTEQGFQAKLPQ